MMPKPRHGMRIAAGLLAPAAFLPHVGPYAAVVAAIAGALLLVLIVGLVLPAVWSRQSGRRRSALEVLRVLLRSDRDGR